MAPYNLTWAHKSWYASGYIFLGTCWATSHGADNVLLIGFPG